MVKIVRHDGAVVKFHITSQLIRHVFTLKHIQKIYIQVQVPVNVK